MELDKEMARLLRRMVLEGSIDPDQGMNFTLIQHDIEDPTVDLRIIAEKGHFLKTVGIPNPLEHDFNRIINDEGEL
jgi:hypothetical protein